jgi:hypothetical protein
MRGVPLKAGDVIGMLTALERVPTDTRRRRWRWQCQCGNVVERRADNLRQQSKPSCGCVRPETQKKPKKPKINKGVIVYGKLPSGVLLGRIRSRPKEIEPGPLSVVERTVIKKFADKPATVIARLLNKPVRAVRQQMELLGIKKAREAESMAQAVRV